MKNKMSNWVVYSRNRRNELDGSGISGNRSIWTGFDEPNSLQEMIGNHEPLTGICGEYMGSYDVLK